MKEEPSLFKMIMYLLDCDLFQTKLEETTINIPINKDTSVQKDLLKAGFDKVHVKLAMRWFAILHSSINSFANKKNPSQSISQHAIRIYDDHEKKLLSPTSLCYIRSLNEMGILDTYTTEIVIDMLFEIQQFGIDLPLIRWTSLIVLYALPDYQEQLLALELLVLDTADKKVH